MRYDEFTVFAKNKRKQNKYKENPKFNKAEKKLLKEAIENKGKVLKTIAENKKLLDKIAYIKNITVTKYLVILLNNAIHDYKSSNCIVCGKSKLRAVGAACSTVCGNKIKNGSFIDQRQIDKAVRKHGKNPKFSNKEMKKLKGVLHERKQYYNVHGLRQTIIDIDPVLDEKLIAISDTLTKNFTERVVIGAMNYPTKLCATCKRPTRFIHHGELGYAKYCSLSCNRERLEDAKKTMINRYGAPSALKSDTIRRKMLKTIQKRYGNQITNVSQLKEVRAKVKRTMLRKYGEDNPSKVKHIQEKKIKTSLERYGTRSPNQYPEIQKRIIASCFKTKKRNLAGREVHLQGYEEDAIRYIIRYKNIKKTDIVVHSDKEMPSFTYKNTEGEQSVYLPDLYLKSTNRIVEVKSIYTIATGAKNWETNKRKSKAVEKAGFKFSLMVMSFGKRVTLPKNWKDLTYDEIRKLMQYKTVMEATRHLPSIHQP